MKKLLMLVVTLMLGAGLAVAQTGSGYTGSTEKPAATKSTKKAKKSSAKKEKSAKTSKKADTGSK